MDKLKMCTSNPNNGWIHRLMDAFPSCITETTDENGQPQRTIDFEALEVQLTGKSTNHEKERYVLSWPEKNKALLMAHTQSSSTLRPDRGSSSNYDDTKNLYIEGDNLDALKLLRETYLGKIDMIYIDPPYNTGSDFIYSDNYEISESWFSQISGDYNDSGERMTVNNGTNGRIHTDWLNMMYPRLMLARDFLSETGAIFISIDDNEQANLKRICDEIFGECNFVTTFVWAAGRKNDSKLVSVSHEYILCYVRSMNTLNERGIKWREKKQGLDDIYREYELLRKQYGDDHATVEKELNKWYKTLNPNDPAKNHKHYNRVDKRGIYFADNISWPGGGGPKYEVIHPTTGKAVKTPSRGWLYSESRLKELIAEDRIQFGADENSVPCVKSYLKDREYSAPYSVFYKDGRAATKRLRDLMGADVFQNPKDETIIQSLIQFCTNKDSIVMDFFSGSATTAHSVFLQNLVDGGNRSFILVQIPEPLENMKGSSESSKTVYDNAIHLLGNKPKNICEIAKERIRRSADSILTQFPETTMDMGFRVFKIASSNMNDVFYSPSEMTKEDVKRSADNVKKDRTSEDLLIQVMLECGIELSAEICKEKLCGKEVLSVDNNYLVACFEDDITTDTIAEMAQKHPYYAILRNSSIASDDVAINFSELFKSASPNTKIKIL